MTLGWILFPAVFLHGSFDFIIMVLNFLSQLSEGADANDDNNGNESDNNPYYGLLGLFLSFSFIIGGLFYYFRESHAQMGRINQIDGARTFVGIKA